MGIWQKLFGKKRETQRDVSITSKTQVSQDTTESHETFILGVDIEEFYCLFGEQDLNLRLISGSANTLYELYERKMRRIKRHLINLGVEDNVVAELTRLENHLDRINNKYQDPTEWEIAIQESKDISFEIDKLMNKIREQLSNNEEVGYSAGIFTARIGLCAQKIIKSTPDRKEKSDRFERELNNFRDIYMRELIRTGTSFGVRMAIAIRDGSIKNAFETAQRAELAKLAIFFSDRIELSDKDVKEISQTVEGILTMFGMMATGDRESPG